MKIQLGYILIIALVFLMTSVQSNAQTGDKQKDLQLVNYTIHRVQPEKPFKYRNEKNEVKEARSAYLVLFNLENVPEASGPVVDFYIGDYKVPEYGETENGIYFRVYEPEVMKTLNKKVVYYATEGRQKTSLNKEFVVQDLEKLVVEDEGKILNRKHP